ncbi:MAG: DUF1795 domain-containing protein [Synergistaceae bacterium]|nr:DUF1795 domain-containing protein [Synergistaceae bacterium]
MEKTYTVLGVDETAGLTEIEEAYWSRKRLYDPVRFTEGSVDWQYARARNDALDEAYRLAAARRARWERDEQDWEDWRTPASPLGELVVLSFVCPVAVWVIQSLVPTIFSDLAPGRVSRLLDVIVLFLGYFFPLTLRFAFLRRPVPNLWAALALFPITLLSADFFSSALLSSSLFPERRFGYVPALYLVGWGLFVLFYAHCAILRLSFKPGTRKSAPFFRRLIAQSLVLALSVGLSLTLCAAFNADRKAVPAAASELALPEKTWQVLELLDAGVMELPDSWYVESSNGEYTQARNGDAIQHIREALTTRPYRERKGGLDFAFEVVVYWWTRSDGRSLPLPREILDKVQDHQLQSLKESFPDVKVRERSAAERGGREVDVLTVETHSVPGHTLRFKNVAFRRGERLYSLTAGYPAHEEGAWDADIDDILRRWRPEP